MAARASRSSRDRLILEPADRRRAVLDVIASANRTLALTVYRLDDPAIIAALKQARGRGVNVEVLVTRRAKGGRRALESLVSEMQSAGFGVRRYAGLPAKYHAKYVVADGCTALIG